MDYDPVYKTAHLFQYGNPTGFHDLKPATGAVMQDFVLTGNQRYFITQAGTSSTGEAYEDTIVTRYNPETGNSDSMRLQNAGHGIGWDVLYENGKTYLIGTWQGKTPDSGWNQYNYVKIEYMPGGPFHYGTIRNAGRMEEIPINNREQLVHIDWQHGWAVCKQYDSAGNDIFRRRQLWEMRSNIDEVYQTIVLPISTGTLQGFTTINDSLFRYLGGVAENGVFKPNDPIAIEQWNWITGEKVAYKQYPDLAKLSSRVEPEGMSVYREANGRASLLIGLTLGAAGSGRRWRTYKFAEMGM